MADEKKEEIVVDDLSSIFASEETEVEDIQTDKEEDTSESKEEDKKEEEKKEPEVDWKKRNDDTLKAFNQTREENKSLKAKADSTEKELAELKKLTAKLNKELFPEEAEAEAKKETEDSVDVKAWKDRVIAAEELTRTVYSDYDTKVGKAGDNEAPYIKAVTENPTLVARVKAAKNPALEAYNIAKEYEFRQSYGKTPEEIKAKLKAEVEAELRKEILAEFGTDEAKTKPIKRPTTLRQVDGAVKTEKEEVVGAPLTAIFGGR